MKKKKEMLKRIERKIDKESFWDIYSSKDSRLVMVLVEDVKRILRKEFGCLT